MRIDPEIYLVIFGKMNDRLKNGIALSLIPQIIVVKWLGSYPEIIERYYSHGLYPVFSWFFRTLFGWIPFSVGDLIYACLFLLAIWYILVRKKHILQRPKIFLRNIVLVLSVAYFTFHLLWGFNYYRQPLTSSLGLKETYTRDDLLVLTKKLIEVTNQLQWQINKDTLNRVEIPFSHSEIFKKTVQGYQDLHRQFPFLRYSRPSVKTSLFSTLLTYMGYGGYLNPFTNEAQVNRKIPNFRFPIVAGHEMAHQLGYSAENETNFVGYLVTLNNDDTYFKYAATAYALGYCLIEIRKTDEAGFKKLYADLNAGVVRNFEEMKDFWKAYENPMEPVFKSVFSTFLKANNQEEGIDSYNRIVSLLVTYHEKYPLSQP